MEKALKPPFKRYVKTENGYIVDTYTGVDFGVCEEGYLVMWVTQLFSDNSVEPKIVNCCDLIIAQADSREELE